jgi:hypothetical protein
MGDGELAVASGGSAKPGGWTSRDPVWLNQKGIDVRILLLFLACADTWRLWLLRMYGVVWIFIYHKHRVL